MPLLEHGALTVDYLDEGDGPAVVLVHSSVSGSRQWKRLVEGLRPRYRCLAPNLLGYGQTSAWPGGRMQTLDDAAAAVLALCQTLPRPIRLVGHSWGGAVALATAHELGADVSHLVLYEPMLAGLLQGHGRTEARAEAQGIYSAVQQLGDAGEWEALAKIFTDYFNGNGAWDSTPPDRQRIIASQLPPNRHEWDAGWPARTARHFAGIRAQTLVLRGDQTRPVTREIADTLCETFPHWHLKTLAGTGHMGPLTHGGVVNAEIQAFLAR